MNIVKMKNMKTRLLAGQERQVSIIKLVQCHLRQKHTNKSYQKVIMSFQIKLSSNIFSIKMKETLLISFPRNKWSCHSRNIILNVIE